MPDIQKHIDIVLDKITSLIRRKNLIKMSGSLINVFYILLIVFFVFTLLESISYFSVSAKYFIFFATLFISFIFFAYSNVRLLYKLIRAKSLETIIEEARELGEKFPNIKDKLTNSLQLVQSKRERDSHVLIEAAFEDIYLIVRKLNFNSTIKLSSLKKQLYSLSLSLVVIISAFMIFPKLNHAAKRLILINKKFEKPKEFTIASLSRDMNVKRGEDVILRFKTYGKSPEELNILTKSSSESEFNRFRVKRDSANLFKYRFRNLTNSFNYLASKGEIASDTFQISVTSPPEINKIIFDIKPPYYSRLPSYQRENNGNITALKGTEINYNISTSKIIKEAKRIYSNEKEDSLEVKDNIVSGRFKITNNDKYYFKLSDTHGDINENPIEYQIKVVDDLIPQIEISRPEQTSMVPNNDLINIEYLIRDDFGFTEVMLKYKKGSHKEDDEPNKFNTISMKFDKNSIEQVLYYNWDVSRLSLRENEILTYYMSVSDNDYVSGPKSNRTPYFQLRVPTIDELYAEVDNIQESAYEELTETLRDAEELQQEFQKISDELKNDQKEINWNEKERIQESVSKFKEMAEKIEDVQEKLNDMSSKMAENNLLSEETMKKYNDLQELIDEMDNEQLKKAFQDMQKSLENLLRDKIQESLENLSFSEEMFKRSIERTMNLLKKIQIEQNVDEIIKRTEKLTEDLNKLANDTENEMNSNNEAPKEDLIKNQENVEKQLGNLEKEMKKLESLMQEVSDMPTEKMNEINEQYDNQMNPELSKMAKEQLENQNLFDALKNQNKLSENMSATQNNMKNLQQELQQQSQQMVMQNMLKAIDNIISLSKEQEAVNQETEKFRSQPRSLPKMADNQSDLRQSLENILAELSQLSQKTFAITPEMGKALGNARRKMSESLSGMQNRNSQKSTFNQLEAMKSLNEAASMLQSSLQAMMQGGGQGGGMMSLMQQLKQMAQQQMGINNLTKMLQQGQLTMEQQAQIQRLAGQQAALQKSLSELNKEAKEAGESKKIAADLEQILDEMKEVISGMNTKKIDDNLIQKQDKILSKLLDAQRSMNERDFEKNRESISGKDFNIDSPGELIFMDYQENDILREELIKSFQSGFSKDYQDIIRKYFESLNNKESQN